ncbi:MAG: hypothetical protein ACKO85_04910 [Isosphaeraceae bacterium]
MAGPKMLAADDKKEAPAIVGRWQLEYDYMGNSVTDEYEIKADKDGALSGRILREGKEITKLEKFRAEGGKVTFTAKGKTEGVEWSADFEARIDGDEIDGTVKISANDQSFDLPWKPKRVKQEKKS